MKVSEAIVKVLELENVKTVYGYPGGAVLPLYEALRGSDINHVLVRNEQSAAHCASGYARASQSTGVCIGTSGPGATNLITGIATAYMDSIPLVVITGQVRRDLIGKDAFQEADITGATHAFTKHNYLVRDPQDIPRILTEAFFIASTGRPGPVLIDIPKDVQGQHINFDYPGKVDIMGYKPTTSGHTGQIKKVIQRLKKSSRPVIYAGGGVIRSNAIKELTKFAEKGKIPVVNTMMGLGSFPMDSDYYAGMIGSHGNEYTSEIIKRADLIIIIGGRLSDRATQNFTTMDLEAEVIHIDIDPAEIGKIFKHQIPVVGDAQNILKKLLDKITPIETDEWMKEIAELMGKEEVYSLEETETINPKIAMRYLSDKVADDAIVVADVGQNQIWAARNFKYSGSRKFFTSGGLGTMGYSLPASIGAKMAAPDKTVIAVMGDGGIQMLLSELGTLSETNEQVIIMLFNNNRLGMVRELQDNTFGKGRNFGVEFGINPDFVKLAEAYGIKGKRITSNSELEKVYEEALASKKAFLIELVVDPDFGTL